MMDGGMEVRGPSFGVCCLLCVGCCMVISESRAGRLWGSSLFEQGDGSVSWG